MTYAERIKRFREVMLITQQELANILDVSVITVNRWENGKFEPSIKVKRIIRKIFNENGVEIEDGK
ncbi:MAG: helix-turn-helix transcriptional regulator [Acholeplasma sp.]|jgi:DNA-binding XRE family transcriptional regulator|nr:helix-turn-helix transcriptional regulator [Acholeplasma sp.]